MVANVFVAGVGMVPFFKPGGESRPTTLMGPDAIRIALADAGLAFEATDRSMPAMSTATAALASGWPMRSA